MAEFVLGFFDDYCVSWIAKELCRKSGRCAPKMASSGLTPRFIAFFADDVRDTSAVVIATKLVENGVEARVKIVGPGAVAFVIQDAGDQGLRRVLYLPSPAVEPNLSLRLGG